MKFAAAVAALLATLAMPALAQHGVARGWIGGHAAGASHIGFASHGGFGGGFHGSFGGGFRGGFHGGFAPRNSGFASRPGGFSPRYQSFAPRSSFASHRWPGSIPYRFTPRGSGSMNRMPYRAYSHNTVRRGSYGGSWHGRDRYHEGDHRRHFDHDRVPYGGFSGYPYSYAYAYPYSPYPIVLDPWLFGPDYDSDENPTLANYTQSAAQPYSAPSEAPPIPYNDAPQSPYPEYNADGVRQQPTRPPYSGARASSSAAAQQTVTLIFKNGRAPEKIQNYMLTATTLTVFDPQYEQIPIDRIDVSATEATNRAKGVDFQVPPAGQ